MKWIIASDIHGSAQYCRQLMQAFEREQADRLLLLGDLLYHGPRNDLPAEYDPKQVIDMLSARTASILCVRGNCEAEVDQMVLPFPVLAEYALISDNGKTLFATHGHIHNLQNLPPLKRGDILLHGHTHIPACEHTDGGVTYLNPGSVSIPKAGSAHSYMLFDERGFFWKELQSGEVYLEWCE